MHSVSTITTAAAAAAATAARDNYTINSTTQPQKSRHCRHSNNQPQGGLTGKSHKPTKEHMMLRILEKQLESHSFAATMSYGDDTIDLLKPRAEDAPKRIVACACNKPPLAVKAGRGQDIYYESPQNPAMRSHPDDADHLEFSSAPRGHFMDSLTSPAYLTQSPPYSAPSLPYLAPRSRPAHSHQAQSSSQAEPDHFALPSTGFSMRSKIPIIATSLKFSKSVPSSPVN